MTIITGIFMKTIHKMSIFVVLIAILALVPNVTATGVMDGSNWTGIDNILDSSGYRFLKNNTGMSNPATANQNMGGYNVTNATNISAKNIGGVIYADQYATIQDAFNNMVIGRTSEQIVVINKDLVLSSSIYVPNYTKIIINANINGNGNIPFRIENVHDVTISGGNITTQGNYLIYIYKSYNIEIEKTYLHDSNGIVVANLGLISPDNQNINIHDNTLENTSFSPFGGISCLYFCTDTKITNNNINNNKHHGIYIIGVVSNNNQSRGLSITGNHINNSAYAGVGFDDFVQDSTISDNIISYPGTFGGIWIYGNDELSPVSFYNTKDITITGNVITNGTDSGINLQNTKGITVTGNLIKNTTNFGISIRGSRLSTISSNTILNSREIGIYVLNPETISSAQNTSDLLDINHNIIDGAGTGIAIKSINDSKFSDNIINNTVTYGIDISESASSPIFPYNNTISGNKVSNSAGTSIISRSNAKRTLIYDNNPDKPIVYLSTDIVYQNMNQAPFYHGNRASAPTAFGAGDTYFNSTANILQIYTSSIWEWFVTSTVSPNNIKDQSINFVISNGSNVIGTGIKGDVEIPFTGTIIKSTALADQTGSVNISWWKDSYANFPPTSGDMLGYQVISSSNKGQSTGLTQAVTAGDILRFNVESVDTVTRVTISLTVRRS